MIEKSTIIDRIEVYANDGRTSIPLKIWKGQIKKLEKEGFNVLIKSPTKRCGEYSCIVSWKYPRGEQAAYMLSITIKALTNNLQDSLWLMN